MDELDRRVRQDASSRTKRARKSSEGVFGFHLSLRLFRWLRVSNILYHATVVMANGSFYIASFSVERGK